ncbi:glycoside hydrolase family 73 protein [Anaerotignum propionicum]|uniref:glycoside hydrolase family 73 protein n=1 Tax=Anaerotignum propionicum TaxID=28446 RepID=UPI00210A253D|nr:glycoside hydrolase family 73 protein [Anaerotignum propionicum]MCQ4936728.1 glycoside hydrolase family 73 protein [Anaerotignum propionicum]
MGITKEQESFISRVGSIAKADMQKSGVLASLTIAQAIIESNWGKSGLTVQANALFGIKAGSAWKGKVYSAKTEECYDGVNNTTITALFRAYDSWEESISDHSALLTRLTRYKTVVGETDYKRACVAIEAAGYATDPAYSDKLINTIETYGLNAFDGTCKLSSGASVNVAKGVGKMNSSEFLKKLQHIVDNYKTLYVMGCFGAPLTGGNVLRYCTNHTFNKQAARTSMIKAAANKKPPVFGFDCVCLIKGVLWGWSGDASKTYGGAGYAVNGVPDVSADGMIEKCTGVSTNFKNIVPGEAVWLPGHIGVYIGNGKVIECTPAFKNCVQVTACLNIGAISGMNGRKWVKHGKLPYISYEGGTPVQPVEMPQNTRTIKPGSTVKLKSGAKTYGGGDLASFVYTREHVVKEIAGNRAVISYGGIVVAAVKLSDLTLIK